MPKIVTGQNSAALNADILALFEEEGLDPIREMIKMALNGHPYADPETHEVKYLPLDPDQRFKVLKELAEYVAPKLKAVAVDQAKKSKTVIKIVRHGEKAVIANGQHVHEIEGPPRDYTQATVDGIPIKEKVKEAQISNPHIKAAAQVEAYGGFAKVRTFAKDEVIDVTPEKE
ncbi:MAG TPA: hypothetical protein VD999_07730 [Vitreimonas sp.]|nr:hypothetical protein [Vitreimonas sp.]